MNVKTLLFAVVCYLSTMALFAQNVGVDVVHLKNGSVIRGLIIEQVPAKQIKVKTSDGSIFVYQMSEIEKMTKDFGDQPSEKQLFNQSNKPQGKRAFIGLSLGLPLNTKADESKFGLGLELIDFGYLFTKNLGISAKWNGMAWKHSLGASYGFGTLMVGPMFHFKSPTNQKAFFDIRPMIGFGVAQAEYGGSRVTADPEFAFSVDAMSILPMGKSFAFRGGLEILLVPDVVIMPKIGIAWRW